MVHMYGAETVYAYAQRHEQVNSHTAASTLMMAVTKGCVSSAKTSSAHRFQATAEEHTAQYTNTPDSANEYEYQLSHS